jgi:hypothetical protein
MKRYASERLISDEPRASYRLARPAVKAVVNQ